MKSILSIALICLLSLTIPANAEKALLQERVREAIGADEAKSGNLKSEIQNPQSAIRNLELVSVGVDEAVITWQTPTPMICQLEYGPQRQLSYQIKEPSPTKYHYRIIGSLKQNQAYEFRILDQNGTPTRTEYFKTLKKPAGKYLFSFAAAADLHCSPNKASKKGMLFSVSGDILRELVTEINGRSVDFTILKGDLTHTGSEAEFEFVKSELVKLKTRVYAVIGNHDIIGQAWQSSFSQISGQLTRYYSFNLKGWHFIILDSSKGSIDKHQLDWLKGDLDKYKTSPTMVFLHHWVNRTSVMDDLADMGNKFSTIIGSRFIDNHAQLRAILESYPQVVSVHSGHAHANLVTQDKGITYIATAALIQYPVSYNVYRVWEGGYTISTYLLPARLEDAAKSKGEIIAQGNQKFANFAIPLGETITRLLWGSLSDRSFTIEVNPK
ncbi:MAG: metallophosphoesterase [bacterium]|nr:metallophosphoesterase [bacterium]